MFILFFVLMYVITTIVISVFMGGALIVANNTFSFIKRLSKFFIVMATEDIGFSTNVVKLAKTGGKSILLVFSCRVAITAVSIAMQHFHGVFKLNTE